MAGSPYKSAPAVFITIFFIISTASSAPVDEEDSTALSNPQDSHISEYYGENNSTSCYYNYQQYQEGDRIITQEPCLNCTCQNRMLMCYLRVCPYTKDVGQDCTVEKRSDQCCPVITCPQVPVQLQLQASSTTLAPTTTAIAHPNSFGCEFNGAFFPDGAQVPPDPKNPCELCYCIRNRTACVLQECTLNVDGCKPVYQKGVCCPVRYDCDYERLATTTEPSNGLIITTTAETPLQCYYQKKMYDDGELITPERSTMSSCERCYCMRGEIVCAVQNCGNPMEGKDCEPVPPPEGQCCPTNYICANETIPIDESDASKIHSDSMVTDVNNLLDKNADKMVESTTAVQSEVTTESSNPQPITASNSPQEYDHVDSEQASSQVEPESEVIDLSVIPAEVTTEAQTEKIATEIMESTSIITNESDKEKGESLPDVTEPESVTSNTVHSEHDTVEMTTVISHSNGPHSVEIDEPEQSSEETMEKYDKDNATPISHVQGSEKITEQPSHPTDSSAGSEEHNTENSMKPEGGESDPVEQEEDSVVPEQETHKETEHSESSVESDEKEESEPEVSSVTTNAPIEISKMPEVGTSQTESDLRATEEPVKESEVTESSSTEKVEAPGKPETDEPAISNSIPHDPTVEHDSVEHDDDIEEPEIHPEVIHQDEEDSKSPQVTESPSSQNADETSPTTVQPTHVENESEPPKEEVSSDMVEENEQLSTSDDKNNIPLEQEAPTVGATSDDVTHPSPAETSEHIPDSQTVGTSIHEEKTDKPTEENEINNTNEQTQKPPQENENENDNAGDATTVQTGMEKGTIPGEGSCLVDEVTYLDGAEIPTSSPCHTECRCYSSIIKCKLMECPPPPSYLTNCIPVPQGEDSCCPVYSCDDKKKYPSLESQSQIGEMTTEHDDQIVENNQSTEANNEVPLPTTEGGAGVAQENTNSAPDENQKPISSVTSAPEEIPAQESVVTEQEEPINKPGVFPPLVSQSAENDGVDTEGFISGTTESSGEHPEEVQPSAQEEVKLENNEAQINEQTVTESGSPVVDQGTVKPESEIETSPNQEQGNENSSDATTLVYDHTQQTTVKTDTVPHDAAIESDLPTSHDSEEPVEHDDIQPVSQDSEEPSDHQESNKPEGTSPPEHQGNSDASTSESTNAPLVEETTSKHEEYEMPEVTTLEPDDHDSVPQESMSTVGVLTEHEPSQTESSDAVKNEVTESSSSHPEGIEVTTEPIKEMSVEYVQTTISSHINHEIVDKNKDEMQSLTNAEQQTTEQQIHDEMQPNIPAILTSIMDNVEKDGVSHYEEHDQEHVANEDQTTAPEIEHPENEKIDQIGTTETIQQHNDDNVEEEHPVQPTTIRSDLQDPTTIRSDLQDPTTILSSEPDSEPQQPETVHIETPQPAIDETSEAEISTDPPKPEHDEEDEVKLTEVETETAHEVESSSEVSQVDQVVTEQQTTAPAEESSPEAVNINVDEIKSEIETTTRIEVEGGEHEEAVVHQTTESEAEQNLHDLMHNMINPPTTHTPTEDVADKDEHTEVVETSHENQDDDDLKKDTTTEVLQQEVVVNEYETPSSITGELPVISSGEEGIKQQENSPDLIHDKEQESNTTPKEEIPEIKPEHEPEMSTESPHVETTTAKLSSMVHHPESEVYTSSVDHFPHLPMNQWTQKPFQPEVTSESPHTPEEGSFHPPSAAGETDYEEEEESVYEPGACRFGGKIFISAQQVPRENPCDFCFCFRSDIICLQQSCPPPILGCREESIHGFCCPRYECPVSMATTFNFTTTTTTTTTTLPPHFLAHNYRGAARRGGCQVQNKFYRVGDEIPTASGPCLQCICGANGQMKCDPKVCSPEPMIRKMIEEAERR